MKDKPEDSARSREETAHFFNRTIVTMDRWIASGCPRNADGKTFNIREVHEWLLEQASKAGEKTGLQSKKLEEEIRKLQLNNDKIAELYILRAEHMRIMTSRAVLLNDYLEKSYQMTRGDRSMRSVEELVEIDRRYAVEMMEAYCGEAPAPAPDAPAPDAPAPDAPAPDAPAPDADTIFFKGLLENEISKNKA
jgi:hypothetical protein